MCVFVANVWCDLFLLSILFSNKQFVTTWIFARSCYINNVYLAIMACCGWRWYRNEKKINNNKFCTITCTSNFYDSSFPITDFIKYCISNKVRLWECSEPQPEPFVGQARLLYIENIFFEWGCRIRQKWSRGFSASEHMIFEIDFPDKTGFQRQNMPFFAHRHPLPGKPGFFKNRWCWSRVT